MKNKILSLQDLYDFYSKENKNVFFSSKENESSIIVSLNTVLSFENENNTDDSSKIEINNPFHPKVKLKICHDKKNRNKTYFSKEVIEDALPSLFNIPILAYIHKLENGDYDFAGHELEIDDNEIIYKEYPVGIIPESCNPQILFDEDLKLNYLIADGLLYANYSKAYEILKNKGECKVSMEIEVKEFIYNSETKILNIEKFCFLGVVMLGRTIGEEKMIESGMIGANITLYNKNNIGEKNKMKLKDLLEKYNVSEEDLGSIFEKSKDVLEKSSISEIFKIGLKTYSIVENSFSETAKQLADELERIYSYTFDMREVYDTYFVAKNWSVGKYYKFTYTKVGGTVVISKDYVEVFPKFLTADEISHIEALEQEQKELKTRVTILEEYENLLKENEICKNENYSFIAKTDEFKELIGNIKSYSFTEARDKADLILAKYYKENKSNSKNNYANSKMVYDLNPTDKKKSPYGGLFTV